MKNIIEVKAKKRVKAKKGFYVHFVTFISVGIFFFLMNIATFGDSGEWWFFFPMIPWSVGLFIHYFVIFGIPGTNIMTDGWKEREMEKEIQRLQEKHGYIEPEDDHLEDFHEEDTLDLKEVKKEKTKRWDDRDLV